MVSPCGISQGSQQKSGLDRRRVFLPLLVPQRDHRIDPRGAMGRQITGSERDHPQHACHDSHYDGIVSFEAEEQRPNSRPSTTHRQHHPAHLRCTGNTAVARNTEDKQHTDRDTLFSTAK